LTCDWNKYNEFEIATGSVDKSIRIWDLRKPNKEVVELHGHSYAVRRLKYSPHSENIIASCSYDMSVMLWDLGKEDDQRLDKLEHHSEFVAGIDFNLFNDQIASAAWDERVCIWNSRLDK